MKTYRYDLHIHSCLSPCGEDEMTPAMIAGIARVEGLDLIALCDHNSAANCPAFLRAARYYEISALCGMELTTAEDIHVLCLFDTLEKVLAFEEYVDMHHPKMKNRPEIFGRQLVVDEDDRVINELEFLLPPATEIGFNDVYALVGQFGGVAVPAHIDKPANSAIATLGGIPPEAGYQAFERFFEALPDGLGLDGQLRFIRDSDAHTPDRIGAAGSEITLPCDAEDLPRAMLDYLSGK